MPKFKVILEGENIYLDLEEKGIKKYGFYTTRWVKATNKSEAKDLAINLLKESQEFKDIEKTKEEQNIRIKISKISEVSLWEFFRNNPGHGFTFFPE